MGAPAMYGVCAQYRGEPVPTQAEPDQGQTNPGREPANCVSLRDVWFTNLCCQCSRRGVHICVAVRPDGGTGLSVDILCPGVRCRQYDIRKARIKTEHTLLASPRSSQGSPSRLPPSSRVRHMACYMEPSL